MVGNEKSSNAVADFLYLQTVKEEVYPPEPQGEAFAIQQMLTDIRKVGYDYNYFADIKLRKISSKKIMEVMLRYYPQMESIYTKETILSKIDPALFPEVREIALYEYLQLSALGKLNMFNLQKTISKGKLSDEWLKTLLDLMNDPDNYASSVWIRERLAKLTPKRLVHYSDLYSTGVLLPTTLSDYALYADEPSVDMLRKAATFSSKDLEMLFADSSYSLSVTMYEYWKKLCRVDCIRSLACEKLNKILKKDKIKCNQSVESKSLRFEY